MRDDEARAAGGQLGEGLLNEHFRARVDGAGGLVEDQHGRRREHHARDAQKLPLSLRKTAVLADDGVIALRQTLDKAVAVRRLRRGDDLLAGGVRLAQRDILPDGRVADPCVLQDHAVLRTQDVPRHRAHVRAVDEDHAFIHVIKAHQQVDERGFAAAGRADDGDVLAGADAQIQILDQRLFRDVGEIDGVEFHLAAAVGQLALLVRRLRGRVDQLKDARGAGKGVLQLRDDAADLVEGLGILIGIGEKAGKPADRQRRAAGVEADQRAAERNDGVDDAVEEARAGIDQRGIEHRVQGAVLQTVVQLVKLRLVRLFVGEGFDDLLVLQHFVEEGGLLAAQLGLLAEEGAGAPGDESGDKEGKRCGQHHDQRDQRVDRQHEADRCEDGHDAGEKLREAHQQAVGKLVDVRDDAADRVAVGVGVDVGQGEHLNFAEGVGADVLHHAVGDAVIDHAAEPLRQRGDPDDDGDPDQDGGNRGEIDLPGLDDAVDGVAHQNGDV